MADTSRIADIVADKPEVVDIATGEPVITPTKMVELLQDKIGRGDAMIVLLHVDGDWELSLARCNLGDLTYAHRLFGIALDDMIRNHPFPRPSLDRTS
jgi:hypothetical protein